ncbi:hypothetical protein Sjap_004766 [Stephania japonica]|uniref:Uncharacterized protein n=1 Tax=Stephania japonica TaxID=461633 RepID=A0AAP0PHA3_9MAGN
MYGLSWKMDLMLDETPIKGFEVFAEMEIKVVVIGIGDGGEGERGSSSGKRGGRLWRGNGNWRRQASGGTVVDLMVRASSCVRR